MGLGALFFLALAYATETGWYASVKRIIEAVAGYLPYGMGLMGLVLLIITFMDGARIEGRPVAHNVAAAWYDNDFKAYMRAQ